jgi:hypothetical protein
MRGDLSHKIELYIDDSAFIPVLESYFKRGHKMILESITIKGSSLLYYDIVAELAIKAKKLIIQIVGNHLDFSQL